MLAGDRSERDAQRERDKRSVATTEMFSVFCLFVVSRVIVNSSEKSRINTRNGVCENMAQRSCIQVARITPSVSDGIDTVGMILVIAFPHFSAGTKLKQMDTFGNHARRDARRREREEHIARMEELVSSELTLWDDDEPIAKTMAEARLRQEKISMLDRIPRRPCLVLLCLVSVIAIATGFVVGLDFKERDNGPTNTGAIEISDETRYKTLYNAILDWKVTSRSDLEKDGSAQWRALQWLAYEDTETKNIEAVRTRYALATLYYSTHDVVTASGTLRSWHDQTHWLSSYPVCLWHGVECHDEDNTMERVISLNLTSNGLGGSLPDELTMLELDIQYLDISDNGIESTIPESLAKLKNLRKFCKPYPRVRHHLL